MDKNLHGRAWLRQPWAPRRPFTLRLREVTVLVNILSLMEASITYQNFKRSISVIEIYPFRGPSNLNRRAEGGKILLVSITDGR